MDSLTSNVVIPELESGEEFSDAIVSFLETLTESAEKFLRESAIYCFSLRSLWEKVEVLRRSPIGQLLPQSLVGRTARQVRSTHVNSGRDNTNGLGCFQDTPTEEYRLLRVYPH